MLLRKTHCKIHWKWKPRKTLSALLECNSVISILPQTYVWGKVLITDLSKESLSWNGSKLECYSFHIEAAPFIPGYVNVHHVSNKVKAYITIFTCPHQVHRCNQFQSIQARRHSWWKELHLRLSNDWGKELIATNEMKMRYDIWCQAVLM